MIYVGLPENPSGKVGPPILRKNKADITPYKSSKKVFWTKIPNTRLLKELIQEKWISGNLLLYALLEQNGRIREMILSHEEFSLFFKKGVRIFLCLFKEEVERKKKILEERLFDKKDFSLYEKPFFKEMSLFQKEFFDAEENLFFAPDFLEEELPDFTKEDSLIDTLSTKNLVNKVSTLESENSRFKSRIYLLEKELYFKKQEEKKIKLRDVPLKPFIPKKRMVEEESSFRIELKRIDPEDEKAISIEKFSETKPNSLKKLPLKTAPVQKLNYMLKDKSIGPAFIDIGEAAKEDDERYMVINYAAKKYSIHKKKEKAQSQLVHAYKNHPGKKDPSLLFGIKKELQKTILPLFEKGEMDIYFLILRRNNNGKFSVDQKQGDIQEEEKLSKDPSVFYIRRMVFPEDISSEKSVFLETAQRKTASMGHSLEYINSDIQKKINALKEGELAIFVDGGFTNNPKKMGAWANVVFSPSKEKEIFGGYFQTITNSYPLETEIMAAKNALLLAMERKAKKLLLFYDCNAIPNFAEKENEQDFYRSYYQTYQKASQEIDITFIHTPAHSKIKYNEQVDHLATLLQT